jgi:hypothetical protein
VILALELGDATSLASADGPGPPLTAIATRADTGEIGSALGDLGFRDRDGILTRRGDETAFLLDLGLVFASEDPALLRGLPDDPREEVPDPLLEELDGPFTVTVPSGPSDCVRRQGASGHPDGSGEVAFLTQGEADVEGIQPGLSFPSGSEIEDPEADENIASAEIIPTGGSDAAPPLGVFEVLRPGALAYEC